MNAIFEPRAPDYSGGPPSGVLISVDGRELPLRAVRLQVDACAGLARVTMKQEFTNPFDEPLQVTYALPMPHDGAVSGFAFHIGKRRVVGEIDRTERAHERLQQALLEGRTAALLEQLRASVFHQEIGNIPPHTSVVAEIDIDQPLDWVNGGCWEWRFPTVVAPRYLGAPGQTANAERLTQAVNCGTAGPTLDLAVQIRDAMADGRVPSSPSHRVSPECRDGTWQVTLADSAPSPIDRDLVIRWPVGTPAPSATIDIARAPTGSATASHGYGLLTLVPPSGMDPGSGALPRDLVLLIDTSGSMSGEPLVQAKRVARALVSSLAARDTLEMIEFSSSPGHWQSAPVQAEPETLTDALHWIDHLRAGGATEMVTGMVEALRRWQNERQRQVVLITDGLVGFENDVVATVLAHCTGHSRLHCVGIGPASNRSLTAPCARAGRGVEVLLGSRDDPASAIQRLLSVLVSPVVTQLQITGSALSATAHDRLPDLYAGAPARIPVELRGQGGQLGVRGLSADGVFELELSVRVPEHGDGSGAVRALYAREHVEGLELAVATGQERAVLDARIEQVGLDFQVATRLTTWIAVSEQPDVDPNMPFRRIRQPQALPQGLSAEGLGLRGPAGAGGLAAFDVVCEAKHDPSFSTRSVESVRLLYKRKVAPRSDAPKADPGKFAEYSWHAHVARKLAPRRELQGAPSPSRPRDGSSAPLRLMHTITYGGQLLFELTALTDTTLNERPVAVRVRWQDGTESPAKILRLPEPWPAELTAGTTVRVVVECPDIPDDTLAAAVTLVTPHGDITLPVES